MNPIQYLKDLYREHQIMWLRERAIRACILGKSEKERELTLDMYKLIGQRSKQQVRRMEIRQGLAR